MTSWLLRQINASEDFAGHLDEVSPHFHHPWVLLAPALLVPLAIFIYLRQLYNLPSVPTAIRAILTSTRVLILALLIVILAGPYLKLHLKSEKKPIVAFLLDHSQSMQLPAGPFESDSELIPIAGAAGYKNVSGQIDADAAQGPQPHQPGQAGPVGAAKADGAPRRPGQEIRPAILLVRRDLTDWA